MPVSNANTRTEAAVAGQFDYVDSLPGGIAGQAQGRPLRSGHAQAFRLAAPGAQHQAGHHVNLAVRQAVQLALNEEDMLFAAFGNKEFYKLNGDLYPEGYPGPRRWAARSTTRPTPPPPRSCWTAPTSPTRRSAS